MNIPLIWKRKRAEESKDEEREAFPASKFLITSKKPVPDTNNQAVYKCKTCTKEFSTFQALGGHRASHSNAKLNGANLALKYVQNKLHECDVCGEKFALGQALGGHMTKHRNQHKEKAKESENMFSLKEYSSFVSTSREAGLVTRDFFPITPSWVNAKQVEIVPIPEMNDAWLELTL